VRIEQLDFGGRASQLCAQTPNESRQSPTRLQVPSHGDRGTPGEDVAVDALEAEKSHFQAELEQSARSAVVVFGRARQRQDVVGVAADEKQSLLFEGLRINAKAKPDSPDETGVKIEQTLCRCDLEVKESMRQIGDVWGHRRLHGETLRSAECSCSLWRCHPGMGRFRGGFRRWVSNDQAKRLPMDNNRGLGPRIPFSTFTLTIPMPRKSASATSADLLRQSEVLRKQAEEMIRREVPGVVAKIKEAITHYGLTAADLGLAPGPTRSASKAPRKAVAKNKGASAGVKFRDGSGNSWTGRGPRPKWFKEALAAGASLESLQVS
jgi:DNA-binding protein H-NS